MAPEDILNFNQDELNEEEDPCWDGYDMVGTKKQGGETVPNCVDEEDLNPQDKIY